MVRNERSRTKVVVRSAFALLGLGRTRIRAGGCDSKVLFLDDPNLSFSGDPYNLSIPLTQNA